MDDRARCDPEDTAAAQRARVRIVVDALLRTASAIADMRRHVGIAVRRSAARRRRLRHEEDGG
jgi:hypothetical protein